MHHYNRSNQVLRWRTGGGAAAETHWVDLGAANCELAALLQEAHAVARTRGTTHYQYYLAAAAETPSDEVHMRRCTLPWCC